MVEVIEKLMRLMTNMNRKTILALTGLSMLASSRAMAVEPGLPSKTSIYTTAARAYGARDSDPQVRNPDWLAEQLLGPAERAAIADHPLIKALESDYRQGLKMPEVAGIAATMIVRTRYIDEKLQAAVKRGAAQVVILGAGFDSRAYRMKDLLKDTKVFEVDYGPTQEYKKRRVAAVLGCAPANLSYAPIDFSRDKLIDVLKKAGYEPALNTFFIWEGVTFYLSEDAVRDTLRLVATQSGPGSSVVFDFWRKSAVDWFIANRSWPDKVPEHHRRWHALEKTFADWGEPFTFGLPDGKERDYLKELGLDAIELSPTGAHGESIKRYLTRQDGSTFAESPPQPQSTPFPLPAGWLVVATVPQR
jgi:methyltransferase (TIGR00027 family)